MTNKTITNVKTPFRLFILFSVAIGNKKRDASVLKIILLVLNESIKFNNNILFLMYKQNNNLTCVNRSPRDF